MPDTTKVQIGDLEVELRALDRPSLALDLLAAASVSPHRAACAALGMAWLRPRTGRPKVTYEQCGFSALRYGGAVLDTLVAADHGLQAVIAAGDVAFGLLTDKTLPELQGAGEAEGFTGPSAGNST